MTNEEYDELNSEISRCRTAEDVVRLRDRIRTYPDDGFRETLFRSLAQYSADVGIILTAEGADPTVEPRQGGEGQR